jgi:hypothetical protein
MQQFHHKRIKSFSLDGKINDEAATPRLKIEYINLLISQMRLSGYVPVLDIEPDFTIDYNEGKKYFEFKLTIYAMYVGKRKSEWIQGIDGHKAIYIQQTKSKEFLTEQV